MESLPPLLLFAILFATGLVAGFIDAIAGGGGLITLPVFLGLGMPPKEALGTNKFQACFGSGSATFHYARAGWVRVSDCWLGIACTAAGAVAGTLLVQQLDPGFLRWSIPLLLILIALYFLIRPQLGTAAGEARMSVAQFHFAFGLGIGFYDGFFGPGTGSFWAMAYMLALGFQLIRATAHTKVMNFTSNMTSFFLFALSGQVNYGAGMAMGFGQVLGARLGSRLAIRKGAGLVRPIFIGIVLAISAKLLYDNWSFR